MSSNDADVLLWLILLHRLRCLLRVVYHFHNVHNSRLFTWCRLCTITATDTVTMAIDSTRSTTTMILKSRRLVDVLYYSHNLFNVTNFHLTKKLSCSKTRWQVKKINYSIVSTKYWFCITYCSTNRTTIQLFYVWWIQWSAIGCNLTFTCKKK